ncbi:MAG: hypothetical protein ACKOX6_09545 [Bdellovibrio sp.]
MKKMTFMLLFLFFVSMQALALSDIEITGEADLNGVGFLLPSGQAGHTEFQVQSLLLDFNIPLKEGNLLYVSLEGAQKRTETGESFLVNTREAYLDLVNVFEGMHGLRLGLIPHSWLEAHYEDWDYRFLGHMGWSISEKWRYSSYSDLGVSFMSELPSSLGEWAISVVNGEGRDQDNAGPHKEGSLFFRFTTWAPWMVSLNYVHGTYEQYGADVAAKERIQVAVVYKPEEQNYKVGLELLDAHDPADAITDGKIADAVGVTGLTGQAVHGLGGSLYTVFSTGPKAEVMVRYDYLNAVVGDPDKTLQSGIVALGYQLTEDIKTALAVDHTLYGDNYGPGVRDTSKVELAAQVLF